MANTAGIAASFKAECMSALHALGTTVVRAATTPDALKAALYLASGSLSNGTTTYATTSEVSGTGYTAGGIAVTNAAAPSVAGTTGIWTPSASLVWAGVTLATAFDAVLIYNSTQGNRAIGVYNFGSQTITAGTFTLTMPANGATTAAIQLA